MKENLLKRKGVNRLIYDLNLIEEEIIKTEKELEILLEESFIAGVAVAIIPTLIKMILFLIDILVD